MKVEEIDEKYRKALETVEKKRATIERHKLQAEKKLKVIREHGWNENDRYAFQGTPQYNESYWAVCEYENKLEEINSAIKNLEEAIRIAEGWKIRLQQGVVTETFFGEIPDVFKRLQNNLVIEWDKWDKQRKEKAIEAYGALGYKEFIKKYGYPDYMFMQKTYEEIHKENMKDAKSLIIDLYRRIIAITGEVKDYSNMHIGDGFNLNGIVQGVQGTCRVESILAGGYNIQRLHVRVLTHKI